jgi:hypothetical protein
VNHSVEFVRKRDGMNTQRMGSLWEVMKPWIKKHRYLSARWRQEYIDEFCFRHNHGMYNWAAVWQILFAEPNTSLVDLGGWDGEAIAGDEVEVEEDERGEGSDAQQEDSSYARKIAFPPIPGQHFQLDWTDHERDVLLLTVVRKVEWAQAGQAAVSARITGVSKGERSPSPVVLGECDDEAAITWAAQKPVFLLHPLATGSVLVEGSWPPL